MATKMQTFDVRMIPAGQDLLSGVPAPARAIITERAIALLAEHPTSTRRDLDPLMHRLWEDVRNRPYDDTGRTVDMALSQPHISGQLRALWEVLEALVATGNLLETLRAQRAVLDEQIRKLEGVPRA